MYEALLDADALLLVTEWKQFRMPSFGVMKKSMKNALIIDGRNIYDAKELADAGFKYSAIGC
jgi:UDPglucose 6-dehydrogenase